MLSGSFRHRAAEGPADLEKVRGFLVEVWRSRGVLCTLRVGDLYWRLYRNDVYRLDERVHIWEGEAGEVLAVAIFDPPNTCDMLIHPGHRGGDVEREQLAWAEGEARRSCARDEVPARITVGGLDGDPRRLELLERRGYVRQATGCPHLWRSLDEPIADPHLPPGFVCRGLAGQEEVEDRVALHRAAFPASRMSAGDYRRLMGCGGYDPHLDVVALAYEGRMAAFCLCWLEVENRVGQIEPMGCHPQFRRRGLGRAVVLEALHRLQQRGAETVVVATTIHNTAAIALYESCGFQAAVIDYDYTLSLS